MVHVVMCDDDINLINNYRKVFNELKKVMDIDCRFFLNSNDLLYDEDLCKRVDILYVDNYMIGLNGIQTAKEIRKMNTNVQIVFFSNSPDFVFDSFEVKASHYLLKDQVSIKEFVAKFVEFYDIVMEQRKKINKEYYVVKGQASYRTVDVDTIIVFEIVTRKMNIHTTDGVFHCYENIKSVLDKFEKRGFYLINRSCCVNMNYIERIDKSKVVLTNGLIFQIAVKKVSQFKKEFANYMAK